MLLTISSSNTIEIQDVLVGEVWVGSGQSNMAGGAGGYAKNDETLAKILEGAPYPKLRLLKSTGAPNGSKWSESTPQAAQGFSALLLAFGERLHRELDVPVGLIVGAVGGTPSGSWLSEDALANDKAAQAQIAEFAKTWDPAAAEKRHEDALAKWEKLKAETEANPIDKNGKKKRMPRKPYPAAGPGEHTRNVAIGNLYERFIRPVVGYGIRGVLWDQGESGTAIQGVDQYTTMNALITGWRKEWNQNEFPFIYVQKPSGGGSAWDYDDPVTREADPFSPIPENNAKGGDGKYREHHIAIREHPNTWMATASDLGPMVHPKNKWGYGQRSALVALRAAYDRDVQVYGPSYESHAVEAGKIRIKFRDVGSGLAFKNGDKLQGFQIAGADKVLFSRPKA